MTAPDVRVWSVTPGLLSEGPRWHKERQELLWVDILGRQMHRGTLSADGALDRIETISVDRHIGAVAPAAGGGYVLAAGPGYLFIDHAGAVHELAQPEAGRTDVRMNDGACDPQGRFWAGTMAYDESPGTGALYRLELDGSCTTVLTGLTISNGIGWSPDASMMYLNDSGTGCLDAFRFDAMARQPHAGKVFAIDGLGVRGLPCLPYRGKVPRSAEALGPGRVRSGSGDDVGVLTSNSSAGNETCSATWVTRLAPPGVPSRSSTSIQGPGNPVAVCTSPEMPRWV